MPPVEQFGAITKWMSDPLPKVPMKPPLQDKYHKNHKDWGYHDEDDYYNQNYGYNLESLRVEDRVRTFAYSPNIDFLRSQNCFALNYQWPSQITLPSMTMSLSAKNIHIIINQLCDLQQTVAKYATSLFLLFISTSVLRQISHVFVLFNHCIVRYDVYYIDRLKY